MASHKLWLAKKYYYSSGRTKFSITATKAVGATADVAKTLTTPGKY